MFDGKSILITGGTGSFGKHFVKILLSVYKPRRVVIYSRDEFKQYVMEQKFGQPCMRFFIGDVRDQDRLEFAMRDADYVVHAAALKQVPTAERNPFECVKTNVHGAENVVRSAIRCGVDRVVALSTDKAANPANLYGATKLASDKIFIAGNNVSGNVGTRFSVVRYGNVVGSRGSVVPLFKELVANGVTELPITDDRMTRFWITLSQGVNFVLTSFGMMRGGEIFVPKIPSMRITDLAEALAPGVPHKIIGIRPGEKLHEVMITEDDSRNTVELSDRYVIEPQMTWWKHETYLGSEGKAVDEGFSYSSDNNDRWLTAEELEHMISSSEDND